MIKYLSDRNIRNLHFLLLARWNVVLTYKNYHYYSTFVFIEKTSIFVAIKYSHT